MQKDQNVSPWVFSSEQVFAWLQRCIEKVENFFLSPASARPLGVLRIGIASVLLAQAFFVRSSLFDFFSQSGLIQGDLAEYLDASNTPRISWLVDLLSPYGISETVCIYGVCGVYLLSVVFLWLGLKTRIAAVLAWFIHWVLMNTGYSTTYGLDQYAHVFLFYLMCIPCGDAFSLDALLKSGPVAPSSSARLGLRVLQIHLCITYFFSGLEKASGPQWWDGELLWRAFSLPQYYQFDMTWLVRWPFVLKVAGWTTLFFETFYCIFIWPKLTRRFWVVSMIGLHLGIAIFLGLSLFGIIMSILTFAVFGVSCEPTREYV